MQLLKSCPPYICEGVSLVIVFEDLWGLYVHDRLPGVVALGIPLPLN